MFSSLSGRIGLVRCRNCSLIFVNPRPSPELLNQFYSGNTYTCHEATGSSSAGIKAAIVLNRIEKHIPTGAPRTLLDYGAGGGGFLIDAIKHGWSARGFEPGKRGLQTSKRLGLDVTDDLESLPASAFGLITLHHVFEHLANPIEVLGRIRNLLANDGRLFIEVPNAGSLRCQLALPILSRNWRVDERYRAFPIHLMYYSRRTLARMLQNAGWVIEDFFTVGMGLDEFFIRADDVRPNGPEANGTSGARMPDPSSHRRFRHWVRDRFLGLGLGENLCVVAYPRNGAK